MRGPALLSLAVASACAGAGGEGRDITPPSRDVIVADAGAAGADGYDYVARRPLAVVALAEGRGLDPAIAKAAVDRLADALDACVTSESARGAPARGAARLVAQIDGDGRLVGPNLRVDPGAGAAESAVLCLVAPAKLLTFPPSDAGVRGIAVEALWGSLGAGGR